MDWTDGLEHARFSRVWKEISLDALIDESAALTPELLREILPIVVSDRRNFSDFFDFVDKAERGNDEVFYPALLNRIETDGNWCHSLEMAFLRSSREKERQRAPSVKIWKWLRCSVPDLPDLSPSPISFEDDLVGVVTAMTPIQLLVVNIMGRFVHGDAGAGKEVETLDFGETDRSDWMTLRDQLRHALDLMAEADVEKVSDIIRLAKKLQAACADHVRNADAQRMALLQAKRDSLLISLAKIAEFTGGADLLEKIRSEDALDGFEPVIEPLNAAISDWQVAIVERDKAASLEDEIRADRNRSRADLRAAGKVAEGAEEKEQITRQKVEATLQEALLVLNSELSAPVAETLSPHKVEEPNSVDEALYDVINDLSDGVTDQTLVKFQPEQVTEHDAPIELAQPVSDAPLADKIEIANLVAILEDPAETAIEPVAAANEMDQEYEPSAVWTCPRELDDLLADYLGKEETALAWHLADLAEEAGHVVPIPPPLLRALAAVPAITGPYDYSTQAVGEMLAAAMSALDRAVESGPAAGQRSRGIALAALMRPALMARDTNARNLLANLSLSAPWSGYGGVVSSLTGLRHDLQPSVAELTALAGVDSKRRLPQVIADMKQWLPGARAAQSMHAPSNTVLHGLLSEHRELGGLFEAALCDDLPAVEVGVEFLMELAGSKNVAEALVAATEKELNRPRRDAIRGMALDWICRKLREGAELLLRWRTAKHEDGLVDDRRKEDLRRYVGNLRKELEHVRGDEASGNSLDAAVQLCVDRAIEDLIVVIDGQAEGVAPVRVSDVLDLPLLRLPGVCQPFAPDDAAYAEERSAQRSRLLIALSSPQDIAYDDLAAWTHHIADRALLPARQIFNRLQRCGAVSDVDLAVLQQELEEVRYAAVADAQGRIKSLRHDLEPLQSIDLSTSQEIQRWLERLATIEQAISRNPENGPVLPMCDDIRAPDIPPDFPQLDEVLAAGRQLRDSVRGRIMLDQERRLRSLIERYHADDRHELAEQAEEVVANLADRDLLTVEDIVIRLQNGQNLALNDDAREDYFSKFYPDFVLALGAADIGGGKVSPAIEKGGQVGPLDFSALDDGERKRSGQLFENWRALKNAMSPNRGDLGQSLRQFMERLGFTSVAIERETILSSQLRTMRMRCDELTAQHWFLPPAFGSEARGSYPVFLASGNIDDEQVTRELAKVGRDAPCILLVFGTLTKARRENFALAMRRAKQTVLLVDEAQMLYLAMGSSWMERLFTCAAPFGYLQPYTTSAGKIPTEMFFGREDEIAKIESTTADGCLVYGGRQLGKSALLHHVRKRFHQPDIGRHAYYLKIDEFGGQVQSADQIWSLIRRELASDQIISKAAENADDIGDGIRDWLHRGGERRILILIDEADMFLASEVRHGFPNLNRLKDMMETSARRFKVVFAGLHNVRRMAKAPNSPLVHLGEPICVGPMNTSSESSLQARRLVTEPMGAAGFHYVSPDLVQAVLTRVNYYPSLVQVFCKALLEGISNQARPRGPGPRWLLENDNLFENNEDINSQIRERFQWTLNLDPRYELIAKVLALYRLDSAESDGGAMRPENIIREVEDFWPRGFEKLPPEDFSAFLDEMVDLGVLIRLGKGRGSYGLRGAQVAQMLGQREQLEHEILQIAEKEPRVDYDPSFYHRRSRPDQSERRSPLSDNALQNLFDTESPGIRFLVAPPGIWGSDAAKAVAELADGWQDKKGLLGGVLFSGGDDELRRLVERGHGRRVLVLPAASKTARKWVTWLAERDQVSRQGAILPVFVGSHEQIAKACPPADAGIPVQMFRARPWERNMVRAWLAEGGLQALDTPECRAALLDVSGGSPQLLSGLRSKLEALVSERRGEAAVESIRAMGCDFELQPGEIGLPESLVPMFCTAVELLENGEERSTLVELLAEGGNAQADQEFKLMERLGLFRADPRQPGWIVCSALGALVFRTCERPVSSSGR
ncbi:MAG: hypothetical protein VR71_18690 [Roseovarius sp. BRH_c41]|nr:MAG: hypothetical protein VR71_18690 [Roseovarius sp. BRH_c41]